MVSQSMTVKSKIMAEKTISNLKKAIYAKLTGSTTLINLLGGNYIYHREPPKDVQYPCLIYSIINDIESPYNDDQGSGKITTSYFRISIFSNSSKTSESDDIEKQVKILLNGQRTLDTTNIICYSCYRDMLMEQMKNPDLQIWVTPVRYRITWSNK